MQHKLTVLDHANAFAYGIVFTFFVLLASIIVTAPFLIAFGYFVSGLPR